MGKRGKARKKLLLKQLQGIKPNLRNVTLRPIPTIAAEQNIQHTNAEYQQVLGTNVYVQRQPVSTVPQNYTMQPTGPSNQWPVTNTNVNPPIATVNPGGNMKPTWNNTQGTGTNTNKKQLPVQSKGNIIPKNQNKPVVNNNQGPGANLNKKQLPLQSKVNVTPKNKMQPAGSNIQRPGTYMNIMQQPVQSKCNITPLNKMQPTSSTIQGSGTNMNTQQLPVQSKGKATRKKKKKKKPAGSIMQGPGTNMNAKQLPVQSKGNVIPNNQNNPAGNNNPRPGTNVNTKQLPVQSKGNVIPKNQNNPAGNNNLRPGTNMNTKQLPVQSKGNVIPKNQNKPAGNNIPGPGTNLNKNQLPLQSKINITLKNKVQPPGSNIQGPGTRVNVTQLPVQSKSNETPMNKMQATGINIQGPVTNTNTKQIPVKSEGLVTPQNNMHLTGSNTQQLASKPAHTAGMQTSLQSQDSSATVTRTSGAAVNAAAPKEVIEVDLTDETKLDPPIKVVKVEPPVKNVIEVDLTNEEPEVEEFPVDGVIDADSSNAARLLAAHPDILSDTSPDVWHKIIVKSAPFERMVVLNAINKQISPEKFIPYFFRVEDGCLTFLVNNCSAALKALFKHNFKVPCLFTVIELKVQLRAKNGNFCEILQKIVSKRLNFDKIFLDLSHLSCIPENEQVVFENDTSKTAHLEELLKMAQEMAPNLVSLSLAKNEISALRHLSVLFQDKTKWKSLRVLDLSDNKIDSFYELSAFKTLRITELYMHGNPICGKYKEDSYIRVSLANLPHLIKLDGTFLHRIPGLPRWKPTYISCSTDGNSAELADQFVEHFFTLYDGADRKLLRGLYHEKAYFSVSSIYLPGQSTSNSARLSSYTAEARNLLPSPVNPKSSAALFRGPEKILMKLEKLPGTLHDPYSFTVDLLHHSDKSAILTVTGVFKEKNQTDTSPRHFMRTFVLVRLNNNEYQIVNDIMYITNATSTEVEVAFMYSKPRTTKKKINPPKQLTMIDKKSMTARYSQLTGMTIEWSGRNLLYTGWNLRKALEQFIVSYKASKIPPIKFKKYQNQYQTYKS